MMFAMDITAYTSQGKVIDLSPQAEELERHQQHHVSAGNSHSVAFAFACVIAS